MRFVHTADLHLGRRIAQMSLEEDLEHVLAELADLVARSRAQALVVAGDVFDSSDPQESAARQWDRFITRMAGSGVTVLAIGGNRDAGARLDVGSGLIARPGIHVAGELKGEPACVEVGGVNFWLIPFVRSTDVRAWALAQGISCEEPKDLDDALRLVCDHIRSLPAFSARPNVAVAHQLVVDGSESPVRADSERVPSDTEDGLETVDYACFSGFDYVALGHLHEPQCVGREACRYAGSPLKLSASEVSEPKSFTVVGIKETEEGVRVKTKVVKVEPLRDFRIERGTLTELLARAATEDEGRRHDFVHAVVADGDATDVVGRLREVWPNLEQVVFENKATRGAVESTHSTVASESTHLIDAESTSPTDAVETALSIDVVEAAPSTDDAESTPLIGADEATPVTDAIEAAPSTDTVETAPSTDAVEMAPSIDATEAMPSIDAVETALSIDAAEAAPATDDAESTPATDATEAIPSTYATEAAPSIEAAESTPPIDDAETAHSIDADLTKSVIDLFHEFFEREAGTTLSSEQRQMVADAYERAARKGDE